MAAAVRLSIVLVLPALILSELPAQEAGGTSPDEIVVTATRREEKSENVPAALTVISAKTLEERATRSLPEAMALVPSVMVQKTAYGQGSPYIRGFTGFHTLILIDGIRLNNSVFRSGPNQYFNTIDPLSVSRLEVVRGPFSVLYGSDAVGGVVNVIPERRRSFEPGNHWGGSYLVRWSDAEMSFVERIEVDGNSGTGFGFYGGFSYKNFGDLKAGSGTGRQPETGYDEWDGDMRMEFLLRDDVWLTVAWQHVDQDEVPRTHRTIHARPWHGTTMGNELRRDLDQNRDLVYGRLSIDRFLRFFDRATFTLSSHRQAQERDRLRTGARRDLTGFEVHTLGASFQLERETGAGVWTVGTEYYRDDVDSWRKNYLNGVYLGEDIQGPVGDRAEYGLLDFYVQNEKSFGALDVITGIRYTRASARADKVEDPLVPGSVISVSDRSGSAVGSIRALYHAGSGWNLFGGVSQGFRAPNLSDLTALDATSAVETPSPGLDPEYYLTCEAGVRKKAGPLEGEVALWRTEIDDMIVQSPTGVMIGGTPEVRKDNVGDGFIHGVEAGLSLSLLEAWTLMGSASWMNGRVDQFGTGGKVDKPVSRMLPFSGRVGVRYEPPRSGYWVMAESFMSADQDRLALRDRTDAQRIPPGGTPGWTVFNLRGGWRVTPSITFVAALENVLNKDYRVHGSGQNEPGRSFILSFRCRF